MKPLIVIPARSGSKRLPKKNIKKLSGKHLINLTIEVAKELFDDDIICVSTDSEEIIRVVNKTGLSVPFIRPAELATDYADTRSVLIHAYHYYSSKLNYTPDVIVLLQPTSPFRTSKQIQEAISLYNDKIDMVVSVKKTKSNPYSVLFEDSKNGFIVKSKKNTNGNNIVIPDVWEFNGAIYVINVNSLLQRPIHEFNKIVKYVMDEASSLDVDTSIDWEVARILMKRILKK